MMFTATPFLMNTPLFLKNQLWSEPVPNMTNKTFDDTSFISKLKISDSDRISSEELRPGGEDEGLTPSDKSTGQIDYSYSNDTATDPKDRVSDDVEPESVPTTGTNDVVRNEDDDEFFATWEYEVNAYNVVYSTMKPLFA